MSAEPKKRDLVVTRIFNAPVKQVWQAWSDPELVRRWWGPSGFTCPVARMDFRVGGTSLVGMRAPQEMGGQDLFNTWTYEQIVPLRRIVYLLRFADQNGKMIDPAQQGLPPEMPQGQSCLPAHQKQRRGSLTDFSATTTRLELSRFHRLPLASVRFSGVQSRARVC